MPDAVALLLAAVWLLRLRGVAGLGILLRFFLLIRFW